MKARCRVLAESSLSTALSAIEIYNKPDFRHREQVFSILMVMAWEALLKARILQESDNRLTSLYVPEGRRYKRNRTGQHLTIGIQEAATRCQVPALVAENIARLVEIRDAAVHLTTRSEGLPYLVFTLGAASLRNYARLIREWFRVGLSDYNFYILPLGFEYPFRTLSVVDLKREPEDVALVMSAVAKAQETGPTEADGYALVCEIRTTLVSAKKITDETDLVAKIDQDVSSSAIIVSREVNLIDKYPYTYTQIYRALKATDPTVNQHDLNRLIATRGIKQDPKYARYNYRSKEDERRGKKSATPVLYNEAFLALAKAELCDVRTWTKDVKPLTREA